MRISDWSSDVCSSDLSSQYPNKIFTVLDFRGDATTLGDAALERRRSEAENDAKDRVDALLKRVPAKQYAPATMTSEERRIYDLFADVPGGRDKSNDMKTGRAACREGVGQYEEHKG